MTIFELSQKGQQEAIKRFVQADLSHLPYHNLNHSLWVLANCRVIGPNFLAPQEVAALELAAIWHDIGYLNGPAQDHEQRSFEALSAWLSSLNTKTAAWLLPFCEACIAATQLGQKASHLAAALLADFDLAYGLTWHYEQHSPLLRQEWTLAGKNYEQNAWQALQKDFLTQVHWQSPYAQQHFQAALHRNLLSLER